MTSTTEAETADGARARRAHFQIGLWALALAAGFGTGLELLIGFRVAAYVDLDVDARRTLWRLAHAHLALLGLIHIAFGVVARESRRPRAGLVLLTAATVALPGGFFLGGAFLVGAEPGYGVLLAPLGALFTVFALVDRARSIR